MFEFLIFNWGFALRNLFKRREKTIDRFSILFWFIPFLILDFIFIMISLISMFLYMITDLIYFLLLVMFSFIIWVFYPKIFEHINNRLERYTADTLIWILTFLITFTIMGIPALIWLCDYI